MNLKRLFIASPIKKGMEMITIERNHKTKTVTLNGVLLTADKSRKLRDHSKNLLSSDLQLALAILLECMSEKSALQYYRDLAVHSPIFWDNISGPFDIWEDVKKYDKFRY